MSSTLSTILAELEITALEPVHKKHAFLRTAARELGLARFHPLAQRLSDHACRDYSAATSRATFDLREWLVMGREFVTPGGIVIGFEGVHREDLVDVTRKSYEVGGKPRALVIATVSRGTS